MELARSQSAMLERRLPTHCVDPPSPAADIRIDASPASARPYCDSSMETLV